MLLYRKYKISSFLNLEDSLETKLNLQNNIYKINSLFKHSKKLIRSLILVHFYIFSIYPFSPLLYRSSARYYISLDFNIILLIASDCYKSYFRAN